MLQILLRFVSLIILTSVIALQTSGAMAQQLRVATYECPPFVMKTEEGAFTGLSIHLWDEIAKALEVSFEYVEEPLDELLSEAAAKTIDAGVSCVSITREREETVNFSHSFYETHLAIAVRNEGILVSIKNFLSDGEVLFWLGIVALVAGAFGGIYFLLEHRINDKLFSRNSWIGKAFEAFLLGLLFITRGPFNYYEFKTLFARAMTVLLAVATTLFIASFTAILASAFTLERLRSTITGPQDLASVRTGVKEASTASAYLDGLGYRYRTFETVPEMLEALEKGSIQAVVADDPVLRYEIGLGKAEGRFSGLAVLPYQFDLQNYGLVLPEDSTIEERINRALLEVRLTDQWEAELNRYFGSVK